MDYPGCHGIDRAVETVMQTTNCLNVRSKFPYRNVPDPVRIEGQVTDLASQRILLLVHGFANSEERAHSSYEKFQAALTAATGYPSGTWGMVWEFHWPGDYPERRLMSFVTYPERIPVAAQSGDFLARFLHESPYLGKRQDLYIVAHSLGCRVALEAMLAIERMGSHYDGPIVREVTLLAAAVSVFDCVLRSGPFQPVAGGGEHVFYSRRDKALRSYVFGLGQRTLGERGKAVGRDGLPVPRWDTYTPTGIGHGDYWGDHDVAKGISSILGIGTANHPERYLPEAETDTAEPPESRRLVERTPDSRD